MLTLNHQNSRLGRQLSFPKFLHCLDHQSGKSNGTGTPVLPLLRTIKSKIGGVGLWLKMKNASLDALAYWASESIWKDPLDFLGLERVLVDKYVFEVVFEFCAGPRERVHEEGKMQ